VIQPLGGRLLGAILFAALAVPSSAYAEEPVDRASVRAQVDAWTTPSAEATRGTQPAAPRLARGEGRLGWGLEVRTAALRQFASDIDGGGRLEVGRLFTQANVSYSPKPKMPLTVSFGYRFDGYDFDGRATGPFPGRPWSDVHSFTVGVPVFVPISPRWFLLAVPVVRTSAEDGAAFEDGISAGGFVGASYKVNDRLRIGPGIGVLTQIEDDPSIFPVILVDWQLARTVRLKTGRGLGATQGPGIFLEWEPNRRWKLAAGGRFDSLRFRLDKRGVAPGGVGEESGLAVVLGATFRASTRAEFAISAGMSFMGELRLEDRDGNLLIREDYDPAPFLGLGFTLRL